MDTILSQKALEEQDSKANALAERRCQSRTGDSKIQAKNKNRIQDHIQDPTGCDSDHGVNGKSLKPEQIIHRKGSRHDRCCHQNVFRIILRIWCDRIGGP